MNQVVRASLIVVILAGLGGLGVWYGSLQPDPAAWALPGNDDIGPEMDEYVGDRVDISGTVVSAQQARIALVDYDRELQLQNHDLTLTVGDRVRVYGRLVSAEVIVVRNAFTVPRGNLWFTYVVSFFAGLWTLGRLVRGWYIETETLTLRRRSSPVTWSNRRDGDDDA